MKLKEENSNYRHGYNCKDSVHYCKNIECNNKVSRFNNQCMSCAKKGHKHSEETKAKMRKKQGINHHSYNSAAKCHRKNKCIDCKEPVGWRNTNGRCKKCEIIRRHETGIINIKGQNNGRYIHGQGNFPYPNGWTKTLKESILKRDNYTCQNCGLTSIEHKKLYNKEINVHHIDYNKENLKKSNLIIVCQKCNIKANTKIYYWFAYYTYKINQLKGELQ